VSVQAGSHDGKVGTNFVPTSLSTFLDPDREQRKHRARQKNERVVIDALEVFQGVWKVQETQSEVGTRPGRMIRGSSQIDGRGVSIPVQ
jgi:hypothetical protein